MRRNISTSVGALLIILILLFVVRSFLNSANVPVIATASPTISVFPEDADEIFILSIPPTIDLNSGITLKREKVLDPPQSKNIPLTVLNHTDEYIVFPNQGFGLAIYSYEGKEKRWRKLELPHTPYAETTILPPKLDEWSPEINNGWDVLEDDIMALGHDQIRLYIAGQGQTTSKIYGAYLDVIVSILP